MNSVSGVELSYRTSQVIEPFVMRKQIVLIVYDTIVLMRDEVVVPVEIGVVEGIDLKYNVGFLLMAYKNVLMWLS